MAGGLRGSISGLAFFGKQRGQRVDYHGAHGDLFNGRLELQGHVNVLGQEQVNGYRLCLLRCVSLRSVVRHLIGLYTYTRMNAIGNQSLN